MVYLDGVLDFANSVLLVRVEIDDVLSPLGDGCLGEDGLVGSGKEHRTHGDFLANVILQNAINVCQR